MQSKTLKYNDSILSEQDSSVQDYFSLLKPRVMSLVVFTSICGIILAPQNIHPFFFFISVLCISVGAGASGAINMWYDRDIDSLMERTKQRPIPNGKVQPLDALGFGVVLSIISVMMLGLAVNYEAALLLAFSIFFYVFIYTMWLKRKTSQNIVIGGADRVISSSYRLAMLNGRSQLASHNFVLHNFFLDTSTLLGISSLQRH